MKQKVVYSCLNLLICQNDQTICGSKCWHTEYSNSNVSITPPISYNYFNVHCVKKQICEKESSLVVRILIKELNHLLLIYVSINWYLFMWIKAVLRSEGEGCGLWSTPWPNWSGLFGSKRLRFKWRNGIWVSIVLLNAETTKLLCKRRMVLL